MPAGTEMVHAEVTVQKNSVQWLVVVLLAVAINCCLFGMLHILLRHNEINPDKVQQLKSIDIIRIKQRKIIEPKRQPPPVKKEEKKPEPPKSKPQNMLLAKPKLPFILKPALPGASSDLELPVLAPDYTHGGDFSGIFSMDDLDMPLSVLVKIPPIFPISAKVRGIEGWVQIKFLVFEDGTVHDVQVKKSEPPGIFDSNVIKAVSRWKFKPGTVSGSPVKTWVETTIRFELD